MSRGNRTEGNPGDVYRLPEDVNETFVDTFGDAERARAFNPRAEFDILNRTVGARLSNEVAAANEDYGQYTGIPSAIARNRARDLRVNEANANANIAIGEGAQAANAAQGDYLQNMARITAGRRRQGFTSTIRGQQGGGLGSAAIGAGGTIGAALITGALIA